MTLEELASKVPYSRTNDDVIYGLRQYAYQLRRGVIDFHLSDLQDLTALVARANALIVKDYTPAAA